MRITHDMLMKIAADTAAERGADEDVTGVYLHGSLNGGDPMLGGAADIDLTVVHEDGEARREIVRLNEDVHLDIHHHPAEIYEDGRGLREQAWMGMTVYHCKILYDPRHFLDFTQANVRGMFDRADIVMKRARPLLEAARRTWLGFSGREVQAGSAEVEEYLGALENTANALACLNGGPLPTRRLLLDLPQRAAALGQEGLAVGLVGLLGGNGVKAEEMRGWLSAWEAAFEAGGKRVPRDLELHAARLKYFRAAMEVMLEGEQPGTALWPLLRTWTRAVALLGGEGQHAQAWAAACNELDLLGEHFETKLAGLDAYLDTVEELFERWEDERGV
ncbi:MAG: hypothetical protein OEV06_03640 [Anaerolineae bacterium]|nr:hypothetical protein [Anaerolineae bacterium]